ncbi:MAG: AAA domain-containing protein, partial [Actinobacteria bacterium]|nr:AAA domain-containing protein [Actinomycetota bacterium]
LPDKAIDLVDEAGSRKRIITMTAPPDYKEAEERIQAVRKEKEAAIENQEFEKAANLRDKERRLIQEKRDLEERWRNSEEAEGVAIGEDEIAQIVAMWTGIPVVKLTETEAKKLLRMEDELHKRIVGQDEALKAVSKAIRRSRAKLSDPRRPTGSFVFLGPSGVGKTELARTLAEFLFGDEDALIQIDMSEYMEKHAVSRLVGSPPGYVGYEEGGQLTEAVRRRPYSVVLMDEIEKAHPDVFNILLQILEDGRLTDSQGRTVDFRNAIVIMTSNIGASTISKGQVLGFAEQVAEGGLEYDDMKTRVMGELKRVFRPEFLNRIDEVIVFHKLTRVQIREIIDLLLDRLHQQLKDRELTVELTEEAKELLVEEGFDPTMGARPLRRAMQRLVEDTLAEEVLAGKLPNGSTVILDRVGDHLIITEVLSKPEEVLVADQAK